MTSGKFVTTLGYERRYNPALLYDKRDEFIVFMTADQPVRPANILNIVAINQGKRPLTMTEPSAAPLIPAEFAARLKDHIVVDCRSSAEFGAGHIPGAYNIHLSSTEFEQRFGWATPPDPPALLVLDAEDDVPRAMHKLAFIGLDQRVQGYLAGGMGAWLGCGKPHNTIAQITVHQLAQTRAPKGNMRVLDVRETSEWDAGHVEGAQNVSYKFLSARIKEMALQPGDHIAVVCAGGLRSSTACSLLKIYGLRHIYNVTGGMDAWAAAGYPMRNASGEMVTRKSRM